MGGASSELSGWMAGAHLSGTDSAAASARASPLGLRATGGMVWALPWVEAGRCEGGEMVTGRRWAGGETLRSTDLSEALSGGVRLMPSRAARLLLLRALGAC